MTDIVERLRRGEHWPQAAADEIERLRAGGCARDQSTTQYCAEAAALAAEVERLRAALREYVCDCPKYSCEYFPCGQMARAALEGE